MRGSGRRAGTTTSEWCLDLARLSGPCLLKSNTLSPLRKKRMSYTRYRACVERSTSKRKRRLGTRHKEHKNACGNCQTDKSVIAEHAWTNDHPINWGGTKILQRASHTMELVMKEALCIQSTPTDSRFNRDGGYELPDCWFTLNRKLRGGAIIGHR